MSEDTKLKKNSKFSELKNSLDYHIKLFGGTKGVINFVKTHMGKLFSMEVEKFENKSYFQYEEDRYNIFRERFTTNPYCRQTIAHEYIEELINNERYKYVFVFYPYTEWNMDVFQRPQQIALAMSKKREDVLYFYCSANFLNDNIDYLERKNPNLFLTTEYNYIMNVKTNKRVLHLYSTDMTSTLEEIESHFVKGDKILYEYIDEIHEDITQDIPKDYLEKHESILKNENYYIVTTADKLYEDAKKVRNTRYILSTNGVNISDFIGDNIKIKENVPDIITELKKEYEKIICYYGALAKWFDFELLEKCANAYPSYCFILIGKIYEGGAFDKSEITKKCSNVKYIGKLPYEELVYYAGNSDLLTIPFLINDVTKSTSPVKVFEYMAMQIPILTTDLPECRKYKSVIIAKNHQAYIELIKKSMKKINSKMYKKGELKEANKNTWYEKAEDIIKLLAE